MKKFAKWALTAVCALGLVLGGSFMGAYMVLYMQPEQPLMPALEYASAPNFINDISQNDIGNTTVLFTEDSQIVAASAINPDGDILSLPELFLGANPAVVAISAETTGRNVFGRIVTFPSSGSGFVVSADGYIVTNYHVIENVSSISVLLYDGTVYPARIIGRDPEGDLAVLKIDAENLSYLTFGDSDELQVGNQVAAIGNPLGEFANSMTVGHISALDREINIDGVPLNMLQTDAAVNRGNSGGPLLNMRGQVIGVVTAKSGGTNVEGLGFAIPSNIATETVSRIKTAEPMPPRPVMGVTVATVVDNRGQTFVRVEHIASGSGAQAAGVRVGDLILAANGIRIFVGHELTDMIITMTPGDIMTVDILRGGEEITLNVMLGESAAL